ncbi:MAG: hypothetical protein R3B13_01855 [Polyangiaceae bacterium]
MRRTHLLLLLTSFCVSNAHAAPSPQDRARELFEKSKPLQDAGKCPEAVVLLREALALHESPDIAANLGMCEASMGKFVDAAEHLEFAVADMMPSAPQATRDRIRKARDIVRKEVGELILGLDPADAGVTVDGASRRVRNARLFLSPGEHALEFTAKGFASQQKVVSTAKGQSQSLDVALERVPSGIGSAGSGGNASAQIPEEPADRGTGRTPATSERSLVPVYVASGVGLVGLGIGVGFFLAGQSKESQADDARTELVKAGGCTNGLNANECESLHDAYSTADSRYNLSTVGFVAAGVGIAAAVGYLLLVPSEQHSSAIRVRPSVALDPRGSGSFQLSGHF